MNKEKFIKNKNKSKIIISIVSLCIIAIIVSLAVIVNRDTSDKKSLSDKKPAKTAINEKLETTSEEQSSVEELTVTQVLEETPTTTSQEESTTIEDKQSNKDSNMNETSAYFDDHSNLENANGENNIKESEEESSSQNYVIENKPAPIEENDPYVDEVIRLVNIERSNEGLPALGKNITLCSAANVRAQEIITVFDHTRPDGSAWSTVIGDFGISFNTIGENIAYGQKTPEEVVRGWMNSPGHRQNIMNPNFTEIGVGHVVNQGSNSKYNYWVQLFKG